MNSENRTNNPAPSARLPHNHSISSKLPFGISNKGLKIDNVKNVIAVASGKGGVGKSTVSTNLAVSLARAGKKVGLLDGDIYGPSSPTMLGAKGAPAVNADKKLVPLLANEVKVMSFGFMTSDWSPAIWRGPMAAKAFAQFCHDTDWGELDYLIIDLPPGTGDIQISMIETVEIKGAIIVTTPQNIALLDAHKAISMFSKLSIPIFGVVENMSFYQCSHCGNEDYIFGQGGGDALEESRGIEYLGQIPLNAKIRMHCDSGKPIAETGGSLSDIFCKIAGKIDKRCFPAQPSH